MRLQWELEKKRHSDRERVFSFFGK